MTQRPQIGTKLTVADRKQLREKYTRLASANGQDKSVFDDAIALLDDLDAIDAAPEHVLDWEKPLIVPGVDLPLTVMQGKRIADAYAAHEADVSALREAEYNARRKVAIAESCGQMTLGALIDAVAALKSDDRVLFDFGGVPEPAVDSYRGFYEHAAIQWDHPDRQDRTTPAIFLEGLRSCLNRVTTGYKGGEYTMHADVPVWCANYGDASRCAIVGVSEHFGTIILHTRYVET